MRQLFLPVAQGQQVVAGIGRVGKLRHIADLIRMRKEGDFVLENVALAVEFPLNDRGPSALRRGIPADLQHMPASLLYPEQEGRALLVCVAAKGLVWAVDLNHARQRAAVLKKSPGAFRRARPA